MRLALEAAEWLGSAHPLAYARFAVARSRLVRKEWVEAAAAFEEALSFAREHGVLLEIEADHLTGLAEAYLGRGDAVASLKTADEALEIARRRGMQLGELDAQILRARALFEIDNGASLRAVAAVLDAAEGLVRKTGAESRRPFIHLARGELAAAEGDIPIRERELRKAHRLFTEIGAPIRAAEVAKELGL